MTSARRNGSNFFTGALAAGPDLQHDSIRLRARLDKSRPPLAARFADVRRPSVGQQSPFEVFDALIDVASRRRFQRGDALAQPLNVRLEFTEPAHVAESVNG